MRVDVNAVGYKEEVEVWSWWKRCQQSGLTEEESVDNHFIKQFVPNLHFYGEYNIHPWVLCWTLSDASVSG